MHQVVKEYLEKQKALEKGRRQKHLPKLGLTEKVYLEPGEKSSEDMTYDMSVGKYYKLIPVEVSDAEYDEICSYSSQSITHQMRKPSSIPGLLKILAYLNFVLGAILFFLNIEYEPGLAFYYLFALIISGIFILGFAGIITLLREIVAKNK